jgi:hypothetical protein
VRRVQIVRAEKLQPGDMVALPHVTFTVQHVYKGGGRVSVITLAGFPVDLDVSQVVSVLRGMSEKLSRTA